MCINSFIYSPFIQNSYWTLVVDHFVKHCGFRDKPSRHSQCLDTVMYIQIVTYIHIHIHGPTHAMSVIKVAFTVLDYLAGKRLMWNIDFCAMLPSGNIIWDRFIIHLSNWIWSFASSHNGITGTGFTFLP